MHNNSFDNLGFFVTRTRPIDDDIIVYFASKVKYPGALCFFLDFDWKYCFNKFIYKPKGSESWQEV